MSETAVNENLESLDSHAAKSMVDIAYTYKAFFKMARVSYSIAKILDLVAIGASFSLLSSLVELSLSNTVNIVLALLLTGISVAHRGIDFSKKGRRFEQTGDAYNSLFKDLREFRDIRIPNGEVSIKDKRTELNHLLERQKELNELTPSTWNLIYRFLDDDDVLGNIEVTEAEKNRL